MEGEENDPNNSHSLEKAISSAILAISTVTVIGFLQLGTPLDPPLDVSLYCFAIAMPVATADILLVSFPEEFTAPKWLAAIAPFVLGMGVYCLLVGMGCVFAYFSWSAGAAFAAISTALWFILFFFCVYRHGGILSRLLTTLFSTLGPVSIFLWISS